jgi:2-polyprenyl-3-methyl-5-hydroxy-6-metoxy-1,4-benzoquinol methylase
MNDVLYHRLRYMLSPQLDLYQSIANHYTAFGKALDFGCGTGVGALQLAGRGWRTDVWDPDEAARHFCSETLAGQVTVLDHPPMQPSMYGLIVAIEVLEHVEDPDETLAYLNKLGIQGCRFVVSSINADGSYKKNHGHATEWGPDEFHDLIQRHTMAQVALTDSSLRTAILPGSTSTPMVASWVG